MKFKQLNYFLIMIKQWPKHGLWKLMSHSCEHCKQRHWGKHLMWENPAYLIIRSTSTMKNVIKIKYIILFLFITAHTSQLFQSVLPNRSRNWNRNRRNRIILTQEEPEPEPYPALGSGSGSGSCCKKNIKLNLFWRYTGQHIHDAAERRNKYQGNRQEIL